MAGNTSKLIGKRRVFVAAYLGEANLNVAKAARIAGYSKPYEEGYRLLRNAQIREAIDAELEHYGIGKNEVLARLARHARASLEDFLRFDGNGATIDLSVAKENGVLDLIESCEQDGSKVRIRLHGSQTALLALMRAYGIDAPPALPTVPIISVEMRAQEIANGILNQWMDEINKLVDKAERETEEEAAKRADGTVGVDIAA
jgi:hypothetical protein